MAIGLVKNWGKREGLRKMMIAHKSFYGTLI